MAFFPLKQFKRKKSLVKIDKSSMAKSSDGKKIHSIDELYL